MIILFKIGLRNILKQKSKTFIIGTLMILGTVILFLGSSFLHTLQYYLEISSREQFTADIIAYPKVLKNQGMSITPFAMGTVLKPVAPYDEIMDFLKNNPNVKALSPQLATGRDFFVNTPEPSEEEKKLAEANPKEKFIPVFSVSVFSVNPTLYQETFPNSFKILEGRFLEEGERGIVLSKYRQQSLKEKKYEHNVGEFLSLTHITPFGVRIRDVKIIGVVEFNSDSTHADFSFLDSITYRELKNIVPASNMGLEELDDATKNILAEDDLDSLFGIETESTDVEDDGKSLSDFEDSFKNNNQELAELLQVDDKYWFYVLIRLKSGASVSQTIKILQEQAKEKGYDLEFGDWQVAYGPAIAILNVLSITGFVFAMILLIATMFIIMNTLILSILERTQEIGTMRALGASKGFIFKLFALESLSMAFIFGVIGIIISFIIMWLIKTFPIAVSRDAGAYELLRLFLVDGAVNVLPSWWGLLGSIAIMGLVGILASLYPISVALKVEPIVAMSEK